MTLLLTLHLIALGIWIGVVGAEFAIEFSGMRNDQSYIKAAELHYQTDIWIEIPAFCIVLITGVLMLNEQHMSGFFAYKILFALLAIMFNIVCVYAVFKRKKYADKANIEAMKSTNAIMGVGALIIPTFLIAFGLSMYSVLQG